MARPFRLLGLLLLLPLLTAPPPAASATGAGDRERAVVRIWLRTTGASGHFRFEPALMWVDPGTRIRFLADSHIHGVRSIPGMLPPGAAPIEGEVGAPTDVTLTVEGVYGIRCPSHYPLGMVGLIVVGDPSVNLDLARRVRHPPAAQARVQRLFALLDCLRRGDPCPSDVPVSDLRSRHLADHPEGQ